MPHLNYCGSFFRVASDELWLPGFCSSFARVWWTIFLLIVTIVYSSFARNCTHDIVIVFLYLTLSIALSMVCIAVELVIIYFSVQGSPIDSKVRDQRLPHYLNLRLAIGMISFPLCLFGFSTAFRYGSRDVDSSCKDPQLFELAVLCLVAIFQLIDASSLICCCCIFSAPVPKVPLSGLDPTDVKVISAEWSRSCRICCRGVQLCTCNLFGGSQIGNEFDAVGRTLTALFHHEGFLDVVVSDVVAGIILTRLSQIAERGGMSPNTASILKYNDIETGLQMSDASSLSKWSPNSPQTEEAIQESKYDEAVDLAQPNPVRSRYPKLSSAPHARRLLQSRNREDRLVIKDMTYYCAFAIAMYSHLLALYMYPVSAPCGICKHKMTTFSKRRLCCCYNKTAGHDSASIGKDPRRLNAGYISPTFSEHARKGYSAGKMSKDAKASFDYDDTESGFGIGNVVDHDANYLADKTVKGAISGDNCIGMNEAGVLFLSKTRPNCELVYASFTNDMKAKPYGIFRDYHRREVLVVLRGTLSLEDVITDAICGGEELRVTGDMWGFNGVDRFAHSGMLRAAQHIRLELEMLGLLDQFGPAASLELVVVGHSLGAGTAALLAMMLHPKYPLTRCYAYGMPGSIMDEITSKECSHYVFSCVLGFDFVCRLNLSSVVRLRENVLDCITRAKVSKLTIMQSVFKSSASTPAYAYMYDPDRAPDTPLRRSVMNYIEEARNRLAVLGSVELVIPGTIIHLHTDSVSSLPDHRVRDQHNAVCCGCCRSQETLAKTAQVVEPAKFKDIILEPSMAIEHFPDRYLYSLQNLAKSWEIDVND